jgi:hypothetical protein
MKIKNIDKTEENRLKLEKEGKQIFLKGWFVIENLNDLPRHLLHHTHSKSHKMYLKNLILHSHH